MKHVVSSTGMVHRLKLTFPVSYFFREGYLTACNRMLVEGEIHDRIPANAPRCWYCYKGK